MPIAASDLKVYSAANVPEDDASTSGGAIDLATQPDVAQLAANDTLEMLSSAAGDTTQVVTVTGRNAAGAVVSENKTLNGTNIVAFTTTLERVLKITMSATAVGTVTIRRSGAGATVAVLEPNQTKAHISFQRSASEASGVDRYEKIFWKNEHGSLTLNDAEVELTADPESRITIGVVAAKDDSTSVANRKTAPGGVSFVDDNVAQAVPGDSLEAASAIGVWIKQGLNASDSPKRSTYTTQLAGTSV